MWVYDIAIRTVLMVIEEVQATRLISQQYSTELIWCKTDKYSNLFTTARIGKSRIDVEEHFTKCNLFEWSYFVLFSALFRLEMHLSSPNKYSFFG